MYCRANDLRCKDVINVRNGTRIGIVGDFEINLNTATICSLVIFGKFKCFGLFGRHKDIIIRWSDIQVIGEDSILVNIDYSPHRRKRNPY